MLVCMYTKLCVCRSILKTAASSKAKQATQETPLLNQHFL